MKGFTVEASFTNAMEKNHDLREFNVFCCKAFAGIGSLHDTIASRSIAIEMRRKLPSEEVSAFRHRAVKDAAAPIESKLECWGQSAVSVLQNLAPAPIATLWGSSERYCGASARNCGACWDYQSLTKALLAVYC
jgi:hypothetical protein